jgi:hypothetical protein
MEAQMENLNTEPNNALTLELAVTPLNPVIAPHNAVRWLEEYFKREPPYLVGDDLATCTYSVGAVILSAVVISTESAAIIAGVTSFPAPFVTAVLDEMREKQLWEIDMLIRLANNLRSNPNDLDCIRLDLACATESVWNAIYTHHIYAALESLRMRIVYGGQPQWWLDEDSCDFLLAGAE